MFPRPPRSTLFPYHDALPIYSARGRSSRALCRIRRDRESRRANARSEEHTSELQSHVNLVCRLLLEKKNFIGRLVQAHDAEEPLSDAELLAAVNLLRLTGNET